MLMRVTKLGGGGKGGMDPAVPKIRAVPACWISLYYPSSWTWFFGAVVSMINLFFIKKKKASLKFSAQVS